MHTADRASSRDASLSPRENFTSSYQDHIMMSEQKILFLNWNAYEYKYVYRDFTKD